MFLFLTGEILLLSTYRESSYRRVTEELEKQSIPCRVQVIRSCSTMTPEMAGAKTEMGSGARPDTEYRLYVKKKFRAEAEEIARRFR